MNVTLNLFDNQINQNSNSNFAHYVKTHCPGYTLDDALYLSSVGEQFVSKIKRGETIWCNDPKEYLSPFIWYLKYLAVEREQGFFQGTFVISDPGHRIEKFFTGSKECYRRWATHFPKRTQTDAFYCNAFGIDVAQDNETGLPAHKSTVVFSAIDTIDKEEVTYFKIEDWGFTGIFAKICHTKDYIFSQFEKWWGKHYHPHYREEYLPPDIEQRFTNLLTKRGTKEMIKEVKRYGLSGIDKVLTTLAATRKKAKALLEEIRKEYPDLNHSRIRTGREVVFIKF